MLNNLYVFNFELSLYLDTNLENRTFEKIYVKRQLFELQNKLATKLNHLLKDEKMTQSQALTIITNDVEDIITDLEKLKLKIKGRKPKKPILSKDDFKIFEEELKRYMETVDALIKNVKLSLADFLFSKNIYD